MVREVDVVDEVLRAGEEVEVLRRPGRARARTPSGSVAVDDPDAAQVRDELARLLVDRARVVRDAAVPVRGEDGEVRVDGLLARRLVAAGEVALARGGRQLPLATGERLPLLARRAQRVVGAQAAARQLGAPADPLGQLGEERLAVVEPVELPQPLAQQLLPDELVVETGGVVRREEVGRLVAPAPVDARRAAADVARLGVDGDPLAR